MKNSLITSRDTFYKNKLKSLCDKAMNFVNIYIDPWQELAIAADYMSDSKSVLYYNFPTVDVINSDYLDYLADLADRADYPDDDEDIDLFDGDIIITEYDYDAMFRKLMDRAVAINEFYSEFVVKGGDN
ncbi:MAG: hypothetical protein LBP26_00065 [Clostridiales bacterium]|jgi:hypothetical protein|nr:hypothetical protein [Clostridiales bacterium]